MSPEFPTDETWHFLPHFHLLDPNLEALKELTTTPNSLNLKDIKDKLPNFFGKRTINHQMIYRFLLFSPQNTSTWTKKNLFLTDYPKSKFYFRTTGAN
jgi:hypothetical protein